MTRLLVLAAALAGCIRANSGFHCSTSTDCVHGGETGTCEPVGYCSFPDPGCPTGERFGDLSGPFANQCVGGGLDAGVDAPTDAPADAAIDGRPDAPPDAPEPAAFASAAQGFAGAQMMLAFPMTVPPGNERFLVVGASVPSDCATPTPNITAVTYNGTALTRIATITGTPCGTTVTLTEQWGLIAPDVGTFNVVITLDGAAPFTIHGGAMSFTGIDQTNPVHHTNAMSGNGMTSAVPVGSVSTDIVLSTVGQGDSILDSGTGQTHRYIQNVDSSIDLNNTGGSTAPAIQGATMMSWTFGHPDEWQQISTSLRQ